MATTPKPEKSERSLFALVRELPGLFMDLVRAEFERLKREMARKLKNIGLGALFFALALMLVLFLTFTLIVAGIFGLAELMPVWAAALTMGGIILVVIVVLVALGLRQFKKGNPPLPTETFDSLVDDANAFKGTGVYDD
jgi:uncharacterized membrane protein YqjE